VWAVLSKHLKECHAKDISEFLAELKEMKWFSQSQPPLKKWKMFWGKTRDVARDAARVAAGEVAWDAAWDAALFARCLLVRDKLDKKFLKHAADRMEVWRRGYGLLCDVKEKLYVYGVKNSKPKKEDGTD
jgi:hypothetical protein